MNKRQKEVIQHQLTMEKLVLDELEKEYKEALKDINLKIQVFQSLPETQSRIYHKQYQETLKKQVEAALEKLHSDEYTTINQYLHDTYTDAFVGTMYDLHGQDAPIIAPIDQNAAIKAVMTDTRLNKPLYTKLGIDVNKLKRTVSSEISRGIASGLMYDEIARNIQFRTNAPISRAKTIVRTEGHRIQQASSDDARMVAKSKGANVVKQWDATMDGDTRPTHRALDGQIRETDEPFEMHGKKAMYPGDFGDPAEDCNCRCVALTRSRAALDADELATLKERAEFFGLDKTEDFNQFKKKYLKAAEKEAEKPKEQDSAPVQPPKTSKPVPPIQPPERQPEPEPAQEQKQDTDDATQKQEKPKFGKPIAKEGKIAEVMNAEMAAEFNAKMQNAPETVRKAYDKYADYVYITDSEAKKHPHFAYGEGLTIDVGSALEKQNGRALYHEIGHNVDNAMHLSNTFGKNGKGKVGRDPTNVYSYAYKNDKFGKAIVGDADAALEKYRLEIVKQYEDAEKKARRAFEKDWLENGTREFMEMLGSSEDEIEEEFASGLKQFIGKELYNAGLLGSPPSTRKELEESFANHIKKSLSLDARSDISDMFESTFKHVDHPFDAGHGLLYWQQAEYLRSTEAFAEMYSSSIAVPESWEQIQKYFPNAVKVFYEMLGDAI